ncbi:MAG TPA: ABC transporter ATP-binding protein [Kofleriaceae bacterium]|nr:ABC transporter ATP-binding protein [Kofleriaceae bacterium]
MTELLGLRNVVKEYRADVVTRVLRGINLSIVAGELVALVGPSGSGKSTLLNILGLLDRPSAGTFEVEGRDVAVLSDRDLTRLRARLLGFVFQFHHLIPSLSAAENVALPLGIASGHVDNRALARARDLLALVGLKDKWRSRPSQLSGGQQQRVAIARSLIHVPRLVLADEPTGNLDSEAAGGVFDLMRQLHAERKVSFLIVTHDPRIAARCARRIEIGDGVIVSDQRQAAVT